MTDTGQINTRNYVISHIDEAIEKGWIKVFYQPVIRSITGRLCGAESLARWIDPEIGFLSPDRFIGPLEEEKLIHKLDSYIIEKVCQDISTLMKNNEPVVPVSVNLSRLDFLMCNMVDVVESLTQKYDIPKDFLHIEITESMIVSDEVLMDQVICKFREAGYEIWMDDFGSGYSSLTLLKDYRFDLLKLDMCFLSSFTDKSKSIVRSVVTMAKNIGVRTLAEGVETGEHFEFLKEIGCGRVQGYYFGKPEPKEDMFAHIKEKGIEVEDRQWLQFYDIASFSVKDTDTPLEIVYDDGKNVKTLFMNRAYREQINFPYDMSYEEIDRIIYHTMSPLLKKYREFADIITKTGKVETFYYSIGRKYLCFKAQALASHDGSHIIKGSINDITINEDTKKKEILDSKLRILNIQYEVVDIVNIEKNVIDTLIGRSLLLSEERELSDDLATAIVSFADNHVYHEDRNRFLEFMDIKSVKSRLIKSTHGFMECNYRVKGLDGNYEWKNAVIVPIPQTNWQEYILCMRPLLREE